MARQWGQVTVPRTPACSALPSCKGLPVASRNPWSALEGRWGALGAGPAGCAKADWHVAFLQVGVKLPGDLVVVLVR